MPNQYRHVTVDIKDGARLVSRASADEVLPVDFTVIRDFRRSLDKMVRREGYVEFWPNKDIAMGAQPYPYGAVGSDPITMIHMARRPNGQTAIIAATKTSIYRYFALESGGYYSTDAADYPDGDANYFTPPDDPEVPETPTGTPYYQTDYGAWVQIGSGFSESGHRWEAVNLNGYAVFNNGVDLPVVYRLEWFDVQPIYELREQGVVSVGTIAVMNGRLLCMDLTEISDGQDLTDLFSISGGDARANIVGVTRSGLITAKQYDGTTVTTPGNEVISSAAFFNAGMVGKKIRFSNGAKKTITAYTSTTRVTVDGSAATVNGGSPSYAGLTFWVGFERVDSGVITATQTGTAVVASSAIFTSSMVGWIIEYDNGATSRIAAYTDSTHVTMLETVVATAQQFVLVPPEYHLISSVSFFTSDHEGNRLVFQNGAERDIVRVYSGTMATTNDASRLVTAQPFFISLDAYGDVPSTVKTNRTQYRIIWSEDENPTGFALGLTGSVVAGQTKITLTRSSESFKAGDSIIITGAGEAGGNLSATITYVSNAGMVIHFDTPVVTTTTEAVVQRAETVGSGVAYYDLADDGSAILRALPLRGTSLIVYKDTGIFEAKFTADTDGLFAFEKVCRSEGDSLYYRWTAIEVESEYHIFAGRNSIYRFDLTNRIPQEIVDAEVLKNIIFDKVELANTDKIYSAPSFVTNEVIMFFSETGSDRAIAYDYLNARISTLGAYCSAAASVKRPYAGIQQVNEEWVLLGLNDGSVHRYGLLSKPPVTMSGTVSQSGTAVTTSADNFTAEHVGWSIRYSDGTVYAITAVTGARAATVNESATKTALTGVLIPAVYHRAGSGYTSELTGGLCPWGDKYSEKKLRAFYVGLASQTPTKTISATISKAVNAFDTPTVVGTASLGPRHNLPIYCSAHLIQDKIEVSGVNKPVEIVHRTFEIAGVKTKSISRVA